MAGSVNKVILVGNVGKDPESQSFSNGGRAVKFSLATSETWRDKVSGDRKEKTEWHNIVIYNEKLGEVAEKYVKKGSKIYLEGAIQSRKWQDNNGQDRYTTEVVLQRFQGELTLLDKAGGEGGGAGSGSYGGGGGGAGGGRDYGDDRGGSPARSGAGGGAAKPFGGSDFADDLDDDVPF